MKRRRINKSGITFTENTWRSGQEVTLIESVLNINDPQSSLNIKKDKDMINFFVFLLSKKYFFKYLIFWSYFKKFDRYNTRK